MSNKQNFPKYLKISILIVALSFLIYHIYWAIQQIFFFFYITDILFSGAYLDFFERNVFLLAFQEYASIVGYFLILIGAIFSIHSTILFIKNDRRYIKKLGKALFFSSFFYIFLLPSSLRHFVGVATTTQTINNVQIYSIFVAFSTLLQALLIGFPLLIVGWKLIKSQNKNSIIKWVNISAPLGVFGFWSYSALLWVYALLPLGPSQLNLISNIGAANSVLTLLIAGIITTITILDFNKKKKLNKRLVGMSIILFGMYSIVYVLVSIWVPIYFSFMQLTEIWLIVLPILGISVLKMKTNVDNMNISRG